MTAQNPTRPIIRFDWPVNADPPALHCPRSGDLVVSDGEGEVDQPASPYVTFNYPDDLSDIELLLEQVPLGGVRMVYELRTSGMACGPGSNRLWVGFDLARGTT
jgi:hypothetical protein